jgi:iron-sulfur cluster repair protein YtfE (RIC family)
MDAKMDLDIVELLTDEHDDIRALFQEVRDAEPQARTVPFERLVERLASHEAAEEALVHPVAQAETDAGRPLVDALLEEEASAERQLRDMTDLDPSADGFLDALRVLEDAVESHAQHEEEQEFPRLREEIGVERRRELARQFQELRESGPTRPHPETPQDPAVRATTGPIVGAFDRARDSVKEFLAR